MLTRKSFQYRLQPTKKQARLLDLILEECRWLYNELLAQRKLSFEDLNVTLTKHQQLMFLPLLKEERPGLNQVHSQVLQNVVDRLDKSFQSFFRRVKAKEKPGFPRFRGMHRYNSFCFPQSGFGIEGSQLKLSKIGSIRIKMHRPIKGEIKTCTLRKQASGEWNVSFSCMVETQPLPRNEKAIGIDVGLSSFAVFSDGKTIDNPRFLQKQSKNLAKAQRKLSKAAKGTKNRRTFGKRVAKIHEKIANCRKEFCHKQSKKIVEEYHTICIEDLNIKKMLEKSFFAKSIMDASWNQFRQFLTYKAADAGRLLEVVDPAYTSQICSQCHFRELKDLSIREHECKQCGYRASRDLNAAQNILALGLDGLGVIPRSPRLQARE